MRKTPYKPLYEGKMIETMDDERCSSIAKNLSDYVYRICGDDFSEVDLIPQVIGKGIIEGIDDHIKLFKNLKDTEKQRVRRYLIKNLIRNLKGAI